MTIRTAMCCSLFLCLVGCARESAPVSGNIRLDDKPMAEGEISFITLGKVPQVLPVNNGKYGGEVRVGELRVEIRAYRMGKPYDMGGVIIEASKENYLPDKYNNESTLKAKVTSSGPNEFDFAVTSQ